MFDVKRSTLSLQPSTLDVHRSPRSSRFPVGLDSVEPCSCLSLLHIPRSMFNLLRRAHVGRFEQEPTEATEVDSSLCFLGYLLLNLAAEAFAPMRRISFRVFGVFRGYIPQRSDQVGRHRAVARARDHRNFEDMDTSAPNQSVEPTGDSPSAQSVFVSQGRLPPVAHAFRWAVAMRAIVAAFVILVMAATYAAENAYNFSVTNQSGEVLGSGKIRLPFKFGADGKGTADWQFTPTQAASTNKYWMKAKARLARGGGKARAECKDSWFTLDFNPGWSDNNVTVSWALKKRESGNLYLADFSGGHPCASFRISQPAAPNGGLASPTNSEAAGSGRHR